MYNRIALAPILIGVNCVYSHICIYTACAYIYLYMCLIWPCTLWRSLALLQRQLEFTRLVGRSFPLFSRRGCLLVVLQWLYIIRAAVHLNLHIHIYLYICICAWLEQQLSTRTHGKEQC